MNSLGLAVLLVAVAAANAGLIAGHLGAPIDTAAVIAGPSGKIVRSGLSIAAPIAAPLAVAHAAPLAVAHAAPLAVAHAAPLTVAHAAPLAVAHAAPLTVAHAAPLAVAHAAPLVSHRAAQLGLELSVPAGSGLEGQWIPDVNEKLYDDGSYKPQIFGL